MKSTTPPDASDGAHQETALNPPKLATARAEAAGLKICRRGPILTSCFRATAISGSKIINFHEGFGGPTSATIKPEITEAKGKYQAPSRK